MVCSGTARASELAAPQPETPLERSERIYRVLRERISLLEYPPGYVLKESELAQEFGLSRTPVRQVLQRLSYEGLVEIRNGVGTTIAEIDLKTFKDVYALRIRLAEIMGELAPTPHSLVDIGALEALRKRVRAIYARPDMKEYARLCHGLHDILLSVIGNRPLREITDLLYYQTARVWLSVLPELDWKETCDSLRDELTDVIKALRLEDARDVGFVRRHYLALFLSRFSRYLETP